MSLRINSNPASLSAQRYLQKSQREVEGSFKALASGSRLSSPQNDASGFAISESLRAQSAGAQQSMRNAQSAQAMLQTAEGSLNEQSNILIRLRELAINSASDTIGNNERANLQQEFGQLVAEFDRIAQSARFGSKQLLSGGAEDFDFHVGPTNSSESVISFRLDADTSARNSGIDRLSVDRKNRATRALDGIDSAMSHLSSVRAELGSVQSRFNFTIDNLGVQRLNLEDARSVIADVDIASETSKLTSSQIRLEAGMAVLSQANAAPSQALRLIV